MHTIALPRLAQSADDKTSTEQLDRIQWEAGLSLGIS